MAERPAFVTPAFVTPAFVTPVHGRHDHLRQQRRILAQVAPGARHVVVAMGDRDVAPLLREETEVEDPDVTVIHVPAGRDGLPLAHARNVGAQHAVAAGADLLVLLDVDCVPGPALLPRYLAAARLAPEALLAGPVTYLDAGVEVPARAHDLAALTAPHAARPSPPDGALQRRGEHALFWSLSCALTPGTWERLGGFCEDYVGYGGEDTDLAWTARAAGVELVWVGGAHAYHQHHPVSRPPVEHVAAIVRNASLFHRRWGQWPMTGWLHDLAELGLVDWRPDRLELVPRP